jgi:hypothetical protein
MRNAKHLDKESVPAPKSLTFEHTCAILNAVNIAEWDLPQNEINQAVHHHLQIDLLIKARKPDPPKLSNSQTHAKSARSKLSNAWIDQA